MIKIYFKAPEPVNIDELANSIRDKINGNLHIDIENLKTNHEKEHIDIKNKFDEFSLEIVECIVNNMEGISKQLGSKPCKLNVKLISQLTDKINAHSDRLDDLEKDVYEIKNKI